MKLESPSVPQIQSDWSGSGIAAIANKPTLGTAAAQNVGAFATAAQGMVADTGWTANSSAGDKTVAVVDYVNGVSGTMVTALNVVSAGLGTAVSAAFDTVVLLRKKVQALETALSTNKLPNA